jgi:hypothetical protein
VDPATAPDQWCFTGNDRWGHLSSGIVELEEEGAEPGILRQPRGNSGLRPDEQCFPRTGRVSSMRTRACASDACRTAVWPEKRIWNGLLPSLFGGASRLAIRSTRFCDRLKCVRRCFEVVTIYLPLYGWRAAMRLIARWCFGGLSRIGAKGRRARPDKHRDGASGKVDRGDADAGSLLGAKRTGDHVNRSARRGCRDDGGGRHARIDATFNR